jgi:8-oxo-dGTP pyrophosphatase MutT (NUDIX family)
MRGEPVRPTDSAGLVLIREVADGPQVLLGRRHRKSRFMPDTYVFPGGRVDPGDRAPSGFPEPLCDAPFGTDRKTRRKLAVFARAALRECYEETGLLLAAAPNAGARAVSGEAVDEGTVWRAYARAEARPAFEALLLVGRAITPVTSPMRFHSRFFLVPVTGGTAGPPVAPPHPEGGVELEDLRWMPLAEAARLTIPEPNALVLDEARKRLERHRRGGGAWPGSAAASPAPCFTWRGSAEHLWRTPRPWDA